MTDYRIGIDIGGTFTDFTVVDGSGEIVLWKEATTPDDPTDAIGRGLAAVARSMEIDVFTLLGRSRLLVHGTTIATNLLIQRSGPRIALLCTEGFRDVLYFRDGYKPDRFNIHLQHPEPLVPRHLRTGIPERMSAQGEVLKPLDEDALKAAARNMLEQGVEAVAIAFLWSIVDPTHERRAVEIVSEELPGVAVVCSSDILPEIREWERTSATVLSAYILPAISRYLRRFEALLKESGAKRSPLIMQVNGGTASVEEILRRPVQVLASGPAAAPAAARSYASELGSGNVITVDMGGTSLDVCVMRSLRASVSRDIRVEEQPIGVPGVEVHSVGAGGGSIASVDAGGVLKVGPRSAGAVPGPAAYGQGGNEPTVTDANVVLGYLAPDQFLGGRRELDAGAATRAVLARVGDPLGLSAEEAAAGIIKVVDSNMMSAIREVSLERGIDTRGFVLVVGGGAGGLHAARIGRALGVRSALIPREAGTLCSFGMTVTDVQHDDARAYHAATSDLDISRVQAIYKELTAAARERMRHDGFSDDEVDLLLEVDARYLGQVHEITIELPPLDEAGFVDRLAERFHVEHRSRFTYDRKDLDVELLHWRLTAFGRMSRARRSDGISRVVTSGAEPANTRPIFSLERNRFVDAPVFEADGLPTGTEVIGPAVVQASTTTVLVPDGEVLHVSDQGSFVFHFGADRPASSIVATPIGGAHGRGSK